MPGPILCEGSTNLPLGGVSFTMGCHIEYTTPPWHLEGIWREYRFRKGRHFLNKLKWNKPTNLAVKLHLQSHFPECVAKGSRLVVSRSAAWSRVRPALLERPQAFADVRSEGAISLPVGRRSKCDQDDVLEFDVIANSMVVAFCDMRGGCVCVLRGRRNTLEAFLN